LPKFSGKDNGHLTNFMFIEWDHYIRQKHTFNDALDQVAWKAGSSVIFTVLS